MKKITISEKIRKFERFLFKGVPDQPESTWERNDNSNVSMRTTGNPTSIDYVGDLEGHFEIRGTFTYNWKDESRVYKRKK
jgi:hypothetical protein